MPIKASNLDLVRESVRQTRLAVLPTRPGTTDGSPPGGAPVSDQPPSRLTAYDQSVAKAVQSIAQTTAIVIQDAGDMLRNVNTVEVTAIGAATAAWLATKEPAYQVFITESITVMQKAAENYLTIGTNAFKVLSQFE